MKRLECPSCGGQEIAQSMHAYTTLITDVGVFVDEQGVVHVVEESEGEHEVQDTERDDAKVFCQDCGFESHIEDLEDEWNPPDPGEFGPNDGTEDLIYV